MTSAELAERVKSVGMMSPSGASGLALYAANRVVGVGQSNYSLDGDTVQTFESFSLARVMRKLRDELADALVYFAQYIILRNRLMIFVDSGTRTAEMQFVAMLHELFTFTQLRVEMHEAA